ncbi:MAG: ABC transporter ATP-binding protein/permease [Lachnospiraceae bacterium]|nr:ABC transporter ATP-binding protein/permease [Lachnospiraceae bacterium]
MSNWLVYIKKYKKEAALAPLFKLLEAVFELFVPLVMGRIIDEGIGGEDLGLILRMGLVLLLLAAVGLTVSLTAQYFAAKAAVGTASALRKAVFDRIMELDYTGVDRVGTSTLIARMTSDINQVQSGINMTLRLFLRSPIIVLGAMIMAFTIDVRSGLIFAVAIPALALVVYGIMLLTMSGQRKVQGHLDKVLGSTREYLAGARVIRAFHREEQELQKFSGENSLLTESQTRVARVGAVTNPVTYLIVNGAIIYLIYTGALRVNAGDLTQGQVVALLNYMNQILVELVKLANLIVTISKALACGKRVGDVLDLPVEDERKDEAGENIAALQPGVRGSATADSGDTSAAVGVPYLQFDHVSLTYEGAGAETLKDISFMANRGDTVGIIGGTGSGKTSLINLIPGFYHATEGSVLLEGRNVAEIPEEELRSRIGLVPQKAVLFGGTIRSNMKWSNPNATEEQIWRAIRRAQAEAVVLDKPGGLDTRVSPSGKNFSGGQKQRLTVARALVRDPEILILDDSSSALDYLTESRMRAAIAELKDTTKIIVSQRASAIMHADVIVVLDEGVVVGLGTHEQLLETCDVYREIYESQFEKAQSAFS